MIRQISHYQLDSKYYPVNITAEKQKDSTDKNIEKT